MANGKARGKAGAVKFIECTDRRPHGRRVFRDYGELERLMKSYRELQAAVEEGKACHAAVRQSESELNDILRNHKKCSDKSCAACQEIHRRQLEFASVLLRLHVLLGKPLGFEILTFQLTSAVEHVRRLLEKRENLIAKNRKGFKRWLYEEQGFKSGGKEQYSAWDLTTDFTTWYLAEAAKVNLIAARKLLDEASKLEQDLQTLCAKTLFDEKLSEMLTRESLENA
jgi:hypothetical protein